MRRVNKLMAKVPYEIFTFITNFDWMVKNPKDFLP